MSMSVAFGANEAITVKFSDTSAVAGQVAAESTQTEAETGGGTGIDRMSARRTKQAIAALERFRADDETKLDGIEDGAQVNPLHIARFAAEDADTEPASDLQDGEIGLYAADGSTQHQSGDVAGVGVIYIPKRAAAFGTNAADPSADLDAYDTSRLGDDLVDNAGSDCIVALTAYGSTDTVWFQASMIEAYGTTGYKLSELTHLKGAHSPASYGIGWNVIVALTHGVAVSDIIDAVGKLVFRADLTGHEEDRFASYNNAFVQNAYRAGDWVLTSDTAGAPSEASQVRQPDIASGNGTVCFGRLRTDADPNDLQWGDAVDADDYPNGAVFYASIDGDKSAHLEITLTSAGTKVEGATDDGDYVYARATWVETGDIADVVDYGDYFRIGREVPSKLKVELPWTDILGAPWLKPTGTELTETDLGDESLIQLASGDAVDLRNLNEYHDLHHVGVLVISGLRYVTNSSPATGGDINFAPNNQDPTKGLVTYKYANEAAKAVFKPKIVVGRRFELKLSDNIYVKGTIESTPSDLFGRLSFNLNGVTTAGARTNNHNASIIVDSNIPGRDEIADQAYDAESPNIAGKGGSAGKIWSWLTSATDAGWKAIEAALLDAAQSSRSSADRRKLLQVRSDDEDELELVAGFPDETGQGGKVLSTTGTTKEWIEQSLLNFYDSGTRTNATDVAVSDTDAIPPPEDLSESGVIETEDITGFGKVFKTSALKMIAFDFNYDATQGVAIRLRSSAAKPTAASDAKSFGDELASVNDGSDEQHTQFDVAANSYFWVALSGGGNRTMTDRSLRVRAAFEGTSTGDIAGVAAGDGLSGGGVSGDVSLAVNTGNGTEINNDKVVVKLADGTISRSNAGIKVVNPFTDDDESKLDGIEANATADQTGAEMVTALSGLSGSGRLPYSALKGTPTIPSVPDKASNADVDAETDDADYVTVLKVFRAIARKVKDASATVKGIVELATTAEMTAGTGNKVPDAAKVKAYVDGAIPSDSAIGDKAFSNAPTDLTASEKEDVLAAVLGSKLTKSVAGNSNVTLTAKESTYRSIRLTGALTGNIVVTVNAIGAGTLVVDNGTTGAYTVKLKATGQADSTAVTLAAGVQVVRHSGTVVSVAAALTDSAIGEKAFSNPPNDLSTSETVTLAARTFVPAQALTAGATPAWDAGAKPYATLAGSQNAVLAAASGTVVGGFYMLVFTQDATGSRTLGFNSKYGFGFGFDNSIASAANKSTGFVFRATSTSGDMDCVGKWLES